MVRGERDGDATSFRLRFGVCSRVVNVFTWELFDEVGSEGCFKLLG